MDIKKLKYLALISLLCLTALIPLFILVRVLVTTGADTISNDYLRFTNLADRVLSQGYDWRFYMKDSLDNNVHSYAFLFLVRTPFGRTDPSQCHGRNICWPGNNIRELTAVFLTAYPIRGYKIPLAFFAFTYSFCVYIFLFTNIYI